MGQWSHGSGMDCGHLLPSSLNVLVIETLKFFQFFDQIFSILHVVCVSFVFPSILEKHLDLVKSISTFIHIILGCRWNNEFIIINFDFFALLEEHSPDICLVIRLWLSSGYFQNLHYVMKFTKEFGPVVWNVCCSVIIFYFIYFTNKFINSLAFRSRQPFLELILLFFVCFLGRHICMYVFKFLIVISKNYNL